MALSSQVGLEPGWPASGLVLSVRRREYQRVSKLTGQLALPGLGEALGRRLLDEAWHSAPNHSQPQTCIERVEVGGLPAPRAAKGAANQLPEQLAGDPDAEGGDRVRIMPLGAKAATPGAGSRRGFPAAVVRDDRLAQRGKNGSARPPGTHRRRCKAWRDDENRASRALRSAPIPALA